MTTSTTHLFHITPACAARGRLEEAERYFLAGNLNEALAATQQAWREHPAEADVFRALAYVHMARGEYPPAAQAAQQALKLDDGNPLSYAGLAQVYLGFGVLAYAEDLLSQARIHFPEDAALLALTADLRFRQHRQREGQANARAALQRNPQDAYAKSLLGTYYLRRGRCADAAPLLDDTVQAYPQRADYLRDLGIALLRTRRYDAAMEHLALSFRLNDDDPITQQNMLYALRATSGGGPGFSWAMSRFMYDHAGLAWSLHVVGLCSLLTGFMLSSVAALDGAIFSAQGLNTALPSLGTPAALILFGLLLLVATFSGLRIRQIRGPRFAGRLRHMLQARGLAEA